MLCKRLSHVETSFEECAVRSFVSRFRPNATDIPPEELAACFNSFTIPAEGAIDIVDKRWVKTGDGSTLSTLRFPRLSLAGK